MALVDGRGQHVTDLIKLLRGISSSYKVILQHEVVMRAPYQQGTRSVSLRLTRSLGDNGKIAPRAAGAPPERWGPACRQPPPGRAGAAGRSVRRPVVSPHHEQLLPLQNRAPHQQGGPPGPGALSDRTRPLPAGRHRRWTVSLEQQAMRGAAAERLPSVVREHLPPVSCWSEQCPSFWTAMGASVEYELVREGQVYTCHHDGCEVQVRAARARSWMAGRRSACGPAVHRLPASGAAGAAGAPGQQAHPPAPAPPRPRPAPSGRPPVTQQPPSCRCPPAGAGRALLADARLQGRPGRLPKGDAGEAVGQVAGGGWCGGAL